MADGLESVASQLEEGMGADSGFSKWALKLKGIHFHNPV